MRLLIDVKEKLTMENSDIYSPSNYPNEDGYYIVFDGVATLLVAKTGNIINAMPLREETITQTDPNLLNTLERLEKVVVAFEDIADNLESIETPKQTGTTNCVDKNFVVDLVKAVKGNK